MISKVERIQAEIESLPHEEFVRLRDWLLDKDWEDWDEQFEADVKQGKLDFLRDEALNEKARGDLRDL